MKRCDLQPWSRFGRLVTTWEVERRNKQLYEKCICDCWNIRRIPRGNLVNKSAKSCWCLRKEHCRKVQEIFFKKHWMAKTRIYRIYTAMKMRTTNKNDISYKYYWERWIRCLWNSFEDFYRDMWESYNSHVNEYWEKQTTLDRINRNWDYCKENCKWSNWKEQMYNRDIVDVYWFNYNNMKKKDEQKSD